MGPRCHIMSEVIPRSLLIAGILAAALAAQPRLVRMTGHVHPMAKAENERGPLAGSRSLPAITLVLRPTTEQRADLDRLLTAQQDPGSPDYHRWLTPEQYADRFGASPR